MTRRKAVTDRDRDPRAKPPIGAPAAAAPAAAGEMPSRMFCLPLVAWRDAACCGLGRGSSVSWPAGSACVRHLLLVSAAETVIGPGCELGGLSLRAAARPRPPASVSRRLRVPCQRTVAGAAGLWCITMVTRDGRPLRVTGGSRRGDRDLVEGMPSGSRVGRCCRLGARPGSAHRRRPATLAFVSEDNKPEDLASLHRRFDELEHVVARRVAETCAAFFRTPQRAAGQVIPAWQRRTRGERRWQVAASTAVAIGLQVAVPGRLAVLRPVWILPALEGILLVTLLIANPHRIDRESRVLRMLGLTLAALISFGNAWSVVGLATGLVRGTEGENAGPLLVTGGAIWLTNVIVFGLWYWEFDRGGPVARALGTRPYPDFQFVQMTSPELAPPDWEPAFADYLYLAFTNASAFSPTDVMPLSRWAKLAMTLQSGISIVTVALVVARAVNILK